MIELMKTAICRQQKLMQKISVVLVYILVGLLPTQLGMFIFGEYSLVRGMRIDYLAHALYMTECIGVCIIVVRLPIVLQWIYTYKRSIALILLLGTINVVWSLSPWVSLGTMFDIMLLVGVGVVIVRTPLSISTLMVVLLASNSVQLVLVLLQYVNQGAVQGVFYWLGERYYSISTIDAARSSMQGTLFVRAYGTFSHPNSLGGFYALIYACILVYWRTIKGWWYSYALAITCITLVLFSFSKGAIGALFIAQITHMFLAYRELHWSWKDVCKPCIVAKGIIGIFLLTIFTSAMGDAESLYKRLFLIEASLQIIRTHLWTGVGMGAYVAAQASIPHPFPYAFYQPVHNIFLLITAELGIVCGIVFWRYVVEWVSRFVRYNRYHVLFVLVIGFTGLIDHYWWTLHQNGLAVVVLGSILMRHD